MNKNLILGFTVMLVVITLGMFLAKDTGKKPSPSTVPEASNQSPSPSSSANPKNIKEIKIVGSEFKFVPDQFTVQEGDTVKLTFTNNGSFPHDFVIEALGVRTNKLDVGESQTVTFVADKAGTFTFVCSVGGHKDLGMMGTLVVEGSGGD